MNDWFCELLLILEPVWDDLYYVFLGSYQSNTNELYTPNSLISSYIWLSVSNHHFDAYLDKICVYF